MFKTARRVMKRSTLALAAGAVVLGGLPAARAAGPSVSCVETNLGIADEAIGAELATNGTLVAAYHFGDPAAGLTDVTVNGIVFSNGVSSIDGENGIITYNDPAMSGFNGGTTTNGLFLNITDAGYNQLVNSFLWGWTPSGHSLTLSGLTPGHNYRMQLIMGNASNAELSLGGTNYIFSAGDVNADGAPPAMLTATWIADAATFIVEWTGLSDGAFSGYALHDVTSEQTATYSISGAVTLDSAGLPGVTVSAGAGLTATTAENGTYTITGLSDGDYTVTPSLTSYTFTPSSLSVTVSGGDQTGKDFTAMAEAVAAITWTETSLDVSTTATGIEIANDGTLVRAYHFGGSDITDVTVNGVLFKNGGSADNGFTDTAMTGTWVGGWGPGWELTAPIDEDYMQLISSMIMASHATGTAVSTITVGGLIVGHTYRLQLISNCPRQGVVDVEGTTGAFTVGDTTAATMLTATWVAGDDTLNMGFVNQNHNDGPHFCGYVLHDMTLPQGTVILLF